MEITEQNKPTRRRPVSRPNLPAPDLARRLATLAAERRGDEILVLDLRQLSTACDFFVLVSGLSEPHLSGIADHLEDTLREEGIRPWHVEGRQNRKWILLDYVDVVVHLFQKDTREYYRLENLWSEAPREEFRLEAPATDAPGDRPEED